jgi:hypothetical protein
MKRLASLFFATAAAAVLVACGGGGDDNKTFFEVDSADDAAHAAMFGPSDLPGSGWEITERDAEDDGDDGFDFEAAAKNEPSCSSFNDLSKLSAAGGIFGGGDDDEDEPVGRAQIELTRTVAGGTLPTTAELEVEIQETVADVSGGWKIVKGFLESEDFGDCMANVITTMFESEESLNGIEIKMTPEKALASAPQDGASMAFNFTMTVPRVLTIDARMEMYMWPYGNAENSIQIMGEKNAITKSLVEDILKAADAKVVQAEKDY